jgi:hypothetical protein
MCLKYKEIRMFNEIKEAIKKRLNKKENADSKLKKVNVDRMEVIDSDQIGYVSDEIIFGTTSRPTEEEYRVELEKMQWWFNEYEKYGDIDALEKFVRESLELENKDYKEFNRQEIQNIKNMIPHVKYSYFGGQRIEAIKTMDGHYEVLYDGHHRMYVAKKYGLRLVVHVSKEIKKIEKDI